MSKKYAQMYKKCLVLNGKRKVATIIGLESSIMVATF